MTCLAFAVLCQQEIVLERRVEIFRSRIVLLRPPGYVPTEIADGAQPSITGDRIAFVRDGAVWTMALDGSGQRRVAAGFVSPHLAPGGREIAAAGRDGLFLIDVESGKHRLLVRGSIRCPRFSPDGNRIAAGLGDRLVLVSRDGSLDEIARIGDVTYVGWSSDGSRIAFVAGGRLFEARPDSSGAREIPVSIGRALLAVWGPDDRTITYAVAIPEPSNCRGCGWPYTERVDLLRGEEVIREGILIFGPQVGEHRCPEHEP